MRSIEVSAKTREQAIEDALSELNAERHQVHVEILDEGSAGFLGFGARPVRLRVALDEEDAPAQEAAPEGGRDSRREGRGRRAGGGQQDAKQRPAREPNAKPAGGGKAAKERPAQSQSAKPAKARPAKNAPEQPAETPGKEAPSSPEMVNEAAAMLQTLIGYMGMEATVSGRVDDEGSIRLEVDSEDSALLIGRKGQTLAALQYILNRIMHREEEGEVVERIIIDIEGYLERRKATLEEMALEMAGKVKQTGRRQRVKPMSAQERRIVHLALQDDPDIKTFSVGNAEARSVVIAPVNEQKDGTGGDNRSKRGGGRRGGQRGRGGKRRNTSNQGRGRQSAE